MNKYIKTITIVGASLILVSCAGQSSDALKDYRDVKATPKTDEKSDFQTAPIIPFVIQVSGATNSNIVNFTEGKKGSFKIVAVPQKYQTEQITDSTLEITNFPPALEKPVITKNSAFEYTITWTPKTGVIPPGALMTTEALLVAVKPTNARLSRYAKEQTIVFAISKNIGIPKIEEIEGLKPSANEGEKMNFYVDITDPTYEGSRLPRISFPLIKNSNTEAYVANSVGFFEENRKMANNPEKLGNNRLRFYYTLNFSRLPDDYNREGKLDLNSPKVEMCFDITVQSANGVIVIGADTRGNKSEVEASGTTEFQRCVTAFYAAQPALVKWENKIKQAIAGQDNIYNFEVSTQNGLSKIQPINVQQLKSLKGATLDCDSQEAVAKLQCKLTWKPDTVCGKMSKGKQVAFPANKKVSLNLKITTELNGITKDKTEVVDFEVLDQESNCASAQVDSQQATVASDTEKKQ